MAQLLPMSDEMIACFGERRLDRPPRHARAHPLWMRRTGARVPAGAGIVVLMVHGRELLKPGRAGPGDQCLALAAAGLARTGGERLEDRLGDRPGVAGDADVDRLGQPDPVGIEVDLDQPGRLRPVVDAVARQRREGVQARAERQHHVRLRDQLHRRLRAVVAERSDRERMRAREGVVVLVVAGNRRRKPLREGRSRPGSHRTAPRPRR